MFNNLVIFMFKHIKFNKFITNYFAANIFALNFVFISMASACGENHDGRLVQVMGGSMLATYYGGQFKEIAYSKIFYGYGWVDEERVFVAYQDDKFAEAAAVIKILNLKTMKHTILGEVGGAGETNFDVNATTPEVVYSDMHGVKLLKFNSDNSYKGALLSAKSCYGVFWLSDNQVACVVSGKEKLDIEIIQREDVEWTTESSLP